MYKGDLGILTNRAVFLENFCSHTFPVLEGIGSLLSLVSALENAAFPVCFTGWNRPFCPSVALDSAPIFWHFLPSVLRGAGCKHHQHHQALSMSWKRPELMALATSHWPRRGSLRFHFCVSASMAVWGVRDVAEEGEQPLKSIRGQCTPLYAPCLKFSFNLWRNLQCWDFLC